ncbi:MAG: universal stress protein [Anaerolineae bacterium]
MSPDKLELRIRRILVALDASEHSLAALDAAVTLASRLEAELMGLFVEDENLLRMADLPITRQIGAFSAVIREFDRADVERELRAQAAVAERALTTAAERSRVAHTFQVRRGSVTSELLEAAADADLVSLGRLGWSHPGWRAVGSTAEAVMERTRCPVLVLHRATYLALPFVTVYDGSEVSRRLVHSAASLAESMDGIVTVLVLDDGSGAIDSLAKGISEELDEYGVPVRMRRLARTEAHSVVTAVHAEEGCGVLVLSTGSEWLTIGELRRITRDVACPVLLVRPDSGDVVRSDEASVGVSKGEALAGEAGAAASSPAA